MVLAVVGLSTLMVLSLALMQVSVSSDKAAQQSRDDVKALFLAETGLSEAAASLVVNSSGALGSMDAPVRYADGVFWVESTDLGDERYQLNVTALSGKGRASIESVVQKSTQGGINFPIVSDKRLDIKKKFFVDAYDSELGTYESQATNSENGITFADKGATVISNGDVRLHKDVTVFGDVFAGPGKKIHWKEDISKSHITGVVDNLKAPIPMPEVTFPPAPPSLGKLHLHGVKDGHTPDDKHRDLDLAPGQYHYEEFKVHKDVKVTIKGPAVITVDKKFEVDTNLVIDGTNGPVVFYVGKEAKIKKKGKITTASGSAKEFFLLLGDPNTDPKKKKKKQKVKIEGKFTGVIYGPHAHLEMKKKEAEVFGSLVVGSMKFKEGSFHYDKSLSRINAPYGGNEVAIDQISWSIVGVDEDLTADRRSFDATLDVHLRELMTPKEAWKPQASVEQVQTPGADTGWNEDDFPWLDAEELEWFEHEDSDAEDDAEFAADNK